MLAAVDALHDTTGPDRRRVGRAARPALRRGRSSSWSCWSGTTRCWPPRSRPCASNPTDADVAEPCRDAPVATAAARPSRPHPRAGRDRPAAAHLPGHGRRHGVDGLHRHAGGADHQAGRRVPRDLLPPVPGQAHRVPRRVRPRRRRPDGPPDRRARRTRRRRSSGSSAPSPPTSTPWPTSRGTPGCSWSRSTPRGHRPWPAAPSCSNASPTPSSTCSARTPTTAASPAGCWWPP